MSRSEIKFWLLILLMNFLLFLPKYLLDIPHSSFLPVHLFMEGTIYDKFKVVFTRFNYDIFRISVDLFVLVFVFWIFRQRLDPKYWGKIYGMYYGLILLFLIYYHTIFKIYYIDPVLYNDAYLLKLGFLNIGESIFLKILLLVIFLVLYFFLLIRWMILLLKTTRKVTFGRVSIILWLIIGISFLVNSIKSGITFEPRHGFQLTLGLLIDNISRSVDARNNLHQFDAGRLTKSVGYYQYQLKNKPDVYLLFFESYGKILYENAFLRKGYTDCIRKYERLLNDSGWYSTSALSTSPISGGTSWISYSTVIYGFNIRNQGSFLHLLRDQELRKYPNMIRFFRNQGYHSFWLDPIVENSDLNVPWDAYTNFYSVDTWIRYKDFNYQGKLYGFGPFPPDQYPVNFAEDILEKTSGPSFLFYITHNSHFPFDSPDSVVKDWHILNRGYRNVIQSPVLVKNNPIFNYLKSVKYDWSVLCQLILRQRHKKAIFILIGDHQPPLLTNENSGFETPVHIISQDSTFIRQFRPYGFNKGLEIADIHKSLKHEAIYSMLLREMVIHFGEKQDALPKYLPAGVPIH